MTKPMIQNVLEGTIYTDQNIEEFQGEKGIRK